MVYPQYPESHHEHSQKRILPQRYHNMNTKQLDGNMPRHMHVDVMDSLQRSLASISFDQLLLDEHSDASPETATPFMEFFEAAFHASKTDESPLAGKELWAMQQALNESAVMDDVSVLSGDSDDDGSYCSDSDDESMYFEDEVYFDEEEGEGCVAAHPLQSQAQEASALPGTVAAPQQQPPATTLPSTSWHSTMTVASPVKGSVAMVSLGSSQLLSQQSNGIDTKSKRYEYKQQILAAWR